MDEVIARHDRSYEREDIIFEPLHYLSLLEQKPNALDQAAPLAGWQLPEEFTELRRQMEGRLGKRGRREYVQVLRLLETFSLSEVTAGVRHALQLQAIAFDGVKHLVLCAIEKRPPKLDLANYPHLPLAEVALTRATDYQVLLQEVQDRHTPGALGTLFKATAVTNHGPRVPETGRTVSEGGRHLRSFPVAFGGIGNNGPGAARHGAPH
jgi:hypothetical protein